MLEAGSLGLFINKREYIKNDYECRYLDDAVLLRHGYTTRVSFEGAVK